MNLILWTVAVAVPTRRRHIAICLVVSKLQKLLLRLTGSGMGQTHKDISQIVNYQTYVKINYAPEYEILLP